MFPAHNYHTKAYSILFNYRMSNENTGDFIVTQRVNAGKQFPSPRPC